MKYKKNPKIFGIFFIRRYDKKGNRTSGNVISWSDSAGARQQLDIFSWGHDLSRVQDYRLCCENRGRVNQQHKVFQELGREIWSEVTVINTLKFKVLTNGPRKSTSMIFLQFQSFFQKICFLKAISATRKRKTEAATFAEQAIVTMN